jgi:hypothetical protein
LATLQTCGLLIRVAKPSFTTGTLGASLNNKKRILRIIIHRIYLLRIFRLPNYVLDQPYNCMYNYMANYMADYMADYMAKYMAKYMANCMAK